MELLDVIAVFLFAAPGGVAVKIWDFVGHRVGRSLWSTAGWGAIVSIAIFTPFQLFGAIDIFRAIGEAGSIEAVASNNRTVVFYLAVFIAIAVIAALLSQYFHSERGQWISTKVLGRTFSESNWAEVARRQMGSWVHIVTSNGRDWMGFLDTVPNRETEGFIVLTQPRLYDPAKNEWLVFDKEATAHIRAVDISHFIANKNT